MVPRFAASFLAAVFFAADVETVFLGADAEADLLVAGFLVAGFLVADFFAPAVAPTDFLAAFAIAPPRPLPRAGVLRSLVGQSMLTHFFHGPRAVSTMIIGAPHSGHVSFVAMSLPRAGRG